MSLFVIILNVLRPGREAVEGLVATHPMLLFLSASLLFFCAASLLEKFARMRSQPKSQTATRAKRIDGSSYEV
jgi:thiosulfate reductase cytochrome b subunit